MLYGGWLAVFDSCSLRAWTSPESTVLRLPNIVAGYVPEGRRTGRYDHERLIKKFVHQVYARPVGVCVLDLSEIIYRLS